MDFRMHRGYKILLCDGRPRIIRVEMKYSADNCLYADTLRFLTAHEKCAAPFHDMNVNKVYRVNENICQSDALVAKGLWRAVKWYLSYVPEHVAWPHTPGPYNS